MALLARAPVLVARPAGAKAPLAIVPRRVAVIRRAANEDPPTFDAEELKLKATQFAENTTAALKEKWEKTDDKPGAVIVTVGTVIAASLAFSVVGFVDKIPLVSDMVELVGLGVTGWLAYRWFTVGADRDEVFIQIKEFVDKVYGKFK